MIVECPKCEWSGPAGKALSYDQGRYSSGIRVCPCCRRAPVRPLGSEKPVRRLAGAVPSSN